MLYIGGRPAEHDSGLIDGNVRAVKLRPERPEVLYDFESVTANLCCESLAVNPLGGLTFFVLLGYWVT
jgi:hypothetical protein